jgi:hypothetical protein
MRPALTRIILLHKHKLDEEPRFQRYAFTR